MFRLFLPGPSIQGNNLRSAGGLPLGGFSGGWLRVGSWFTDGALGVPEVGSRGGICSVGDGTFFVHAANRISASVAFISRNIALLR